MIKCVIWDLDNTLWKGVFSENKDVVLDESALSVIKTLNAHGVVNSICSRNDNDTTLKKMKSLGISEYFILPQISWDIKSSRIKYIMKSLSFKAQDILFIDDNEFERDEVKKSIKDINIYFSENLQLVLELFNFKKTKSSDEALERITMYKNEESRIKIKETFVGDNKEFLKSCDISVVKRSVVAHDLSRVHELTSRTNQMNATAMRYTEQEILAMLEKPLINLSLVEVKDKYGDYGRAGFFIVHYNNKESLLIDSFIISCRLMGKGIAQYALAKICDDAKSSHIRHVQFKFKRTKFNRQLILLLTLNGFELLSTEGDEYLYTYDTQSELCKIPEWINEEKSP